MDWEERRAGALAAIIAAAQSAAPVDAMLDATVLVVDDEEIVRDVAAALLERLGYRTLVAASGREALSMLRAHPGEVDAVLLDMTMPELDGVEMLRTLHREHADVPVLLTSGHAEADATQRLGDVRPAGFIQKPYTSAELAERVGAVLAAR